MYGLFSGLGCRMRVFAAALDIVCGCVFGFGGDIEWSGLAGYIKGSNAAMELCLVGEAVHT